MFDAKSLLDQFLGAGTANKVGGGLNRATDYAKGNPMATGAAVTGLAALLLGTKGGRAIGGRTLELGGIALVGGLACKAFTDWKSKSNASNEQSTSITPEDLSPPPSKDGFQPLPASEQERSLALLTAMIAAAKADGYIDESERTAILGKLDNIPLDAEARAFVIEEMSAPLNIDKVVQPATNQEIASEIYLASLLGIDPDHPAEKAYLAMLAARLKLPDALIQHLHTVADEAHA